MKLRDDSTVPEAVENPPEETSELIGKYEKFLLEGISANALAGQKVVLDTGNGAAYRIAPEVFRSAGAEVVVMNDAPDGRNINENCGALHPESMAARVVEEHADFGVAFDGDADRAIFADDVGAIRDGDEIIFLWAKRELNDGLLSENTVVTTVMSNLGFERQLEHEGIRLMRAQVGDKYVLETMLVHGAVLGGEQSGHIIDLNVHTTGDGIHTALVIGELLAAEGRPFSGLATFEPVPQILLNERVQSKPPLEELAGYMEEIERARDQLGDRGRILVRYSGTENLVRVMVEGDSDAEIKAVARKLCDVLKREIAGK